MTSSVSRAEVMQYLSVYDNVDLSEILDCFGYEARPIKRKPVSNQPYEEVFTNHQPSPRPSMKKADLNNSLPPEVFYKLEASETSTLQTRSSEAGQEYHLDWVKSIGGKALDLDSAPKRLSTQPPKHIPLVSWAKLWPSLRHILTKQQTRKRADLPKLIKQVERAEQFSRVPQQKRHLWSARMIILMDRPKRLNLLNKDYLALEAQLKTLRGATGLESWFIRDLSIPDMLQNGRKKIWQTPNTEIPILILSDLGIYDKSGDSTTEWLRFGQKLKAAGCVVFVLVPAPLRYLSNEITHCFSCISWDRFSSLSPIAPTATSLEVIKLRIHKDQKRLAALMSLLSVAAEIEPNLLRAIRYQLQIEKPWDISFELMAWNHKHVNSSSNSIQIFPEKIANYRNQLKELVEKNPLMGSKLYRVVKQQLNNTAMLDYADALCTIGRIMAIEGDPALEAAERYLKQFILAVHEQQHNGALFSGHFLLQRQDERSLKNNDYMSSLWAILKTKTSHPEPRPDALQNDEASAFLKDCIESIHILLVQQGKYFYLGTRQALETLQVSCKNPEFNLLAELEISQTLVTQVIDGKAFDNHFRPDEILLLPADGRPCFLHIDGQRLSLVAFRGSNRSSKLVSAAGSDSSWFEIEPTGQDEFGNYFDLVVRGNRETTQRFRYIEPQTFYMGSPKKEFDRLDNEIYHKATIVQGYWLAESVVTQRVWESVMGDKPSFFKGDELPVEQVSWHDTQNFIKKLKKISPLPGIRLPTEEEWECACRATTRTPFSFGQNINPDQVNYDGEFPYNQAAKGLERARTVEIKSLPPNQWGLYEMHGNVHEWCDSVYPTKREKNTEEVSKVTLQQVVKGGSWADDGRDCRSARRVKSEPDKRGDSVGFRLAISKTVPYQINNNLRMSSNNKPHLEGAFVSSLSKFFKAFNWSNDK